MKYKRLLLRYFCTYHRSAIIEITEIIYEVEKLTQFAFYMRLICISHAFKKAAVTFECFSSAKKQMADSQNFY